MITKTTDKQLIREALFGQIENLLFSISDPYSGQPDRLKELDIIDVELYLEKIVGLQRDRPTGEKSAQSRRIQGALY